MATKNRIAEALEFREMKQIELAEKSGISKGTINNWIKNKYQPKQKSLMVLAKILDVSELWLAGYDAPRDRAPEQKKNDKLVELVAKLRRDSNFYNMVCKLSTLEESESMIIEQMLTALTKK